MASPLILFLTLLAAGAALGCGDAQGGRAETTPPNASAAAGGLPERSPTDEAAGGTAAADECAGLVPATVPAPQVAALEIASGALCAAGFASGAGRVALGERLADGEYRYHALTSRGALLNVFHAPGLYPLIQQPAGFHALTPLADGTGIEHEVVSDEGRTLQTHLLEPSQTVRHFWSIAGAPDGGSIVALGGTALAGNHWFGVAVHRFAADGAPLFSSRLVEGADPTVTTVLAAAVSTGGDSLVFWNDHQFGRLRWFEERGAAIGAEFPESLALADPAAVLRGTAGYELAPLLDGSVVLREEGRWIARIPARAAALEAAPEWLQARAGWSVRILPSRRGYALVPRAAEPTAPCGQAIEIHAPSGRRCGEVRFDLGPARCTTGAITVGWDGTVVQQVPEQFCAAEACSCSWRWWPALLGGR